MHVCVVTEGTYTHTYNPKLYVFWFEFSITLSNQHEYTIEPWEPLGFTSNLNDLHWPSTDHRIAAWRTCYLTPMCIMVIATCASWTSDLLRYTGYTGLGTVLDPNVDASSTEQTRILSIIFWLCKKVLFAFIVGHWWRLCGCCCCWNCISTVWLLCRTNVVSMWKQRLPKAIMYSYQ